MSKVINLLCYKQEKQSRNNHKRLERTKYARMEKAKISPWEKISPLELKSIIQNNEDLRNNNTKCANLILEVFKIDASKKYVPIIKILNSLGIKVYKQAMEPKELSAYISVSPEYYDEYGTMKIACINEDDAAGHSRFALAHELAHYIFDYDEQKDIEYFNTYMKDDKNKDTQEQRANDFAANLLMPKEIFIKKRESYQKETNSMPEVIEHLAKHFGVSAKSIIKRFDEVSESN